MLELGVLDLGLLELGMLDLEVPDFDAPDVEEPDLGVPAEGWLDLLTGLPPAGRPPDLLPSPDRPDFEPPVPLARSLMDTSSCS